MQYLISLFVLFNVFTLPLEAVRTQRLSQYIHDAARQYHLDPKLVDAVVRAESNFKVRATSPKGAMGLMQVMKPTAKAMDIHSPYHALNNLMGACRYLRTLINRYEGDLKLALAAYNAGPQKVDQYKGIPPFEETKNYVKKVLRYYEQSKKR